MSDGRRRRQAKQGRRDARRRVPRDRNTADVAPLVPEIRDMLSRRRPVELLGLASALIHAATPDPLAGLKSRRREVLCLDTFVTRFIDAPCRETTALLAVLAEVIIDDEDLRARCRQTVATRDDMTPAWARRLADVDAYRAVRMTHVLGDTDQQLIGARLTGGHELTCVVYIDHNLMSEVKDIFFVQDSIDTVLRTARDTANPDTRFVEMSLADARAWITQGLENPLIAYGSDKWWQWRALVNWLIRHLPDNGTPYRQPEQDSRQIAELLDTFFASQSGMPFNTYDYRELLLELLDTGTGDPLRWSASRVEHALGASSYGDPYIPIGSVLNAPEVLRSFIPFAHAQSGIRAELTADAIAVVDRMAQSYKQEVLERAADWGDDFGVDAS